MDTGESGTPKFIGADVWKRAQYYLSIRKSLEYLEKSFGESVGLTQMAMTACMEKTAFSRAFRRKTGITVHEFIQAYRVSQAAASIETSDRSITDIAFSVGFSSLDTFERVFKRVAGATPRSYRLEVLRANGLTAMTRKPEK